MSLKFLKQNFHLNLCSSKNANFATLLATYIRFYYVTRLLPKKQTHTKNKFKPF